MIKTKEIDFAYATGPEITGKYGDTFENTSAGNWDFGGAEISNVVINSAGGFNSMTKTFFVEPNFSDTGVFYSTIQGAIDAAEALASDEKKVILVFPGLYDEQITVADIINLDIIGVGKVYLKYKGASGTGSIIITDSQEIVFKNFNIYADSDIDAIADAIIFSINNSNMSIVEDVNSILTTTGTTDFHFIKLTTLSGPVFLKNISVNLDYTVPALLAENYVRFLNYSGSGTEGQVKIENCKFKMYVVKNDTDFKTNINFLNFNTDILTTYSYFINNSEFEYSYHGSYITFDSLRMYKLNNKDENYTSLSFFNSFINCDYDIDILSQNVVKDSNFVTLI